LNKKNNEKNIFRKILDKKAGKRFSFAYTKINRYINNNFLVKIIFFALGICFICLGFLLLFMPGPGLLFILAGSTLLCVSSKKIALLLDKLEKKSRG
jgi:hypothetical protein